MIAIIVAADPKGIIGNHGTLPWHIPEDLKLFKKRTIGSSIIMGRNTWDSLPKKPLLGRVNYVVSTNPPPCIQHRCLEETLAGPIFCKSFQAAIDDALLNEKDIFIIGGERIYKTAIESGIVDRIILSRLHDSYEGDRYFNLPESGWVEVEKEKYEKFDVVQYVKKFNA